MWHLPQLSGLRACSAENECRLWQAEQEPSEPSGLMRPMPVLGQVAGSSLPLGKHLDFAAVALPAAVDRRGADALGNAVRPHAAIALDHLGQRVVERTEDPRALRVMRFGELLRLLRCGSGRSPWAKRSWRCAGLRAGRRRDRPRRPCGTRSSRRWRGNACWRPIAGKCRCCPAGGIRCRPGSPSTGSGSPQAWACASGATAAAAATPAGRSEFGRWFVFMVFKLFSGAGATTGAAASAGAAPAIARK